MSFGSDLPDSVLNELDRRCSLDHMAYLRPSGAVRIRLATENDIEVLPLVQIEAGARFREIGMHEIADNAPLSVGFLERFQQAGLVWVSIDEADRPSGFLIAVIVDEFLHIEQVSVHPEYAGQGVGKRLVDAAAVRAAEEGLRALSLITFRNVPWNAPYYWRIGFREMSDEELTEGLRGRFHDEIRQGLDPRERVCMLRIP